MSRDEHNHGSCAHAHGPSSTVAETLDEMDFGRSIHAACLANNTARVKAILDKHTRGPSPANALDSAGYTPLHYASRAGNNDICTLLINAGADLDARTPELGTTPLLRALSQMHLSTARLLLSYGAVLDLCSSDGDNVFHTASLAFANLSAKGSGSPEQQQQQSLQQFIQIVQYLRQRATPETRRQTMLNATNKSGRRPIDCLPVQFKDPLIVSLLQPTPATTL
ncbi:Ankyrin repeat domain-containing protein 39 [Actinomortierella ambigua]|nr:Ankyrin repeat domain-containing protein 39 [Actinomortierella ambigua]